MFGRVVGGMVVVGELEYRIVGEVAAAAGQGCTKWAVVAVVVVVVEGV